MYAAKLQCNGKTYNNLHSDWYIKVPHLYDIGFYSFLCTEELNAGIKSITIGLTEVFHHITI